MSDSKKKDDSKEGITLSKLSVLLSVVAGLALAVLLLLLCVTENAEVSRSRADSGFVRVEDYSCLEIPDADTPIGVRKEYTFFLGEELDSDTHLAFYTVHQYVEVYLDGQQIYSLKPSEEKRISKTVGSNWVMLPLYREDDGKEIRVEITPVYESFRNREVEFLIGSQLAIYKDRLWKDMPQLILGIMAVFVGIVFICISVYSMVRKHRGESLVALGIFSVMMGIWRLTDTRFTPFILPDKPVLLFYTSIAMLMIGMVPLIQWIKERLNKVSCCILNVYCIGASLVCLVQLVLQFSGVLDLRETLLATHIVIAVGAVLTIGNVIYERIRYPQRSQISVGKKLPLICVAGVVADVVAFYIKGNSSGLLFSLLAFLLYIVFMGIATMFNYSEQEAQLAEKDRQLAEQERKLTERRIAVMMSQIRTHFIFNVLTAISGYCKYDPQKADEALICFARYLRRNIKIIEEEGLIDFSKELEQVEDYISLEQLRFQDMITFEKDIEEENFKIPPLTIQPIIENAIKHGLVEHGRSGTVELHTAREEEDIVITIIDDGAGFSPEECEKEDSVGLKNVRFRLETMVHGSLTIESSPGKGTKATIRLPVKEAGKR
ncbi:MAG: sensor histidine kinase [Lachnospiraceae bacterium]